MNEKSEQINELVKALVEAQKEIHHAKKDSENPHFRSGYASLASVIDAVRGGLCKYGLSVIQKTGFNGDKFVLQTLLAHTSGQFVSGEYLLAPDKATPQGYGSALSYARRYSLLAILNIATEDDDGNGAMQPQATKEQRVLSPAKPTPRPTASAAPSACGPSEAQVKRLFAIAHKNNWTNEDVREYLVGNLGISSTNELTYPQYQSICEYMETLPKDGKKETRTSQ